MQPQSKYTTVRPDTQTGQGVIYATLHARETLTELQETAIELHNQGVNVVPLQKHSKKPFALAPFFTSRLHHCNALCHHSGRDTIAPLFRGHNLGVIAGRTSGNLIDIDCDSHAAFIAIGQELDKRSLPYWAFTSHKGGGYLLRVIEGEIANMPNGNTPFSQVEIWGNRHLVVVPPSIHESGELYTWKRKAENLPAVSITALDWLGVAPLKREYQEPDLHGLPEWGRELSLRNRQTFGERLSEGERNTRLFSLACDMAGLGIDYREAEQVIRQKAKESGLSVKETRGILKSAYGKTRTNARAYFQGETLHEWQRAQEFAVSYDWKGTFGRRALTRKTVFLACTERAKMDGRVHWRATKREVAELANMSDKSALQCLRDLRREGLIKKVAGGKGEPAMYRFGECSNLPQYIYTGRYSGVNYDTPKMTKWAKEIPVSQGEQDVFRRLGRNAWQVWRYLLRTEARSIAEIARSTGINRTSVSNAIKALSHVNVRLVTMSEGVYSGEPVGSDEALQKRAAFWFDGASPSQARKEQHRLERERRVNQLTAGAIRRLERA